MPRFSFTEFEAFADAVEDASVRMRIPSMDVPIWTLHYANVGSIRLQQGFEGGGNIAEGSAAEDGWVLFHQRSRTRPGLANGQVLNADQVFLSPPNGEFCLACQPSHDWTTVTIPTSLLPSASNELELDSRSHPQVLTPNPCATSRFTSLVHRFLATGESKPSLFDSPAAIESFRSELLAAVGQLITSSPVSSNRHFVRWRQQTLAAAELAQRADGHLLSIADLARQSGVAERTLRTAFQKCYGLSPARYLRISLLNEARRLLRASQPEQNSVTDIAFSLGFWDLGRFASSYRRLFGELPSATLRTPAVG